MGHYFRNKYDTALENYPYINSNVQITRVEVWVTNRNNQIEDVRNILAFQDLGETDNVSSSVNILSQPQSYPDNSNNAYDPTAIGDAGSQLTNLVRDIASVQSGILVPNINEGIDYGKLENAQKLRENIDYQIHPQLGYISLTQKWIMTRYLESLINTLSEIKFFKSVNLLMMEYRLLKFLLIMIARL